MKKFYINIMEKYRNGEGFTKLERDYIKNWLYKYDYNYGELNDLERKIIEELRYRFNFDIDSYNRQILVHGRYYRYSKVFYNLERSKYLENFCKWLDYEFDEEKIEKMNELGDLLRY